METFDDSFDCIGNYRPDAPIRKCLSSLNSRNTGMDDVKSFRKSVVTRNCVDISSVGRVLNQRTCKNEQKCRAKVQHDYADYAKITPESIFLEKPRSGRGGGKFQDSIKFTIDTIVHQRYLTLSTLSGLSISRETL